MKIISIIHCIFRLATDKGDSGDYKEKSDTSDIRTKGHKILISLFSHNRIDVRKYTYNSLKVCHKYLCVKYTSSQCMYILVCIFYCLTIKILIVRTLGIKKTLIICIPMSLSIFHNIK